MTEHSINTLIDAASRHPSFALGVVGTFVAAALTLFCASELVGHGSLG